MSKIVINIDEQVIVLLNQILELVQEVADNMVTKADFDAAIAELTTAIADVAADIEELIGKLQTGNMTDAEEQSTLTELQRRVDALKVVAGKYESTPTEPPTEPTT